MFFKNTISLALDFQTFPVNMKMSSSLSKIFETGINVFNGKYQIIKKEKYYEILTIYLRICRKIYDDYWL